MCELFGASAGAARDYARWLIPFRQRGGATADNADGWGIAYWQQGQSRIEKSPEPGWQSERLLDLAHSVSGEIVLAHVRKARHPPVPGLLNTHPFVHACCGREWVFAHNGLVPAVGTSPCTASSCQPLGETDSEWAFCHLLAGIAGDFDTTDHSRWLVSLATVAAGIAATGKFNFLLSDGRFLIAYGHDRLHYLDRARGSQPFALVATEPLDDDAWHLFTPGELRVYWNGMLLARHVPAAFQPIPEGVFA
jgi:glutamine amidotransferase